MSSNASVTAVSSGSSSSTTGSSRSQSAGYRPGVPSPSGPAGSADPARRSAVVGGLTGVRHRPIISRRRGRGSLPRGVSAD